jgi:hypothetical protein
MEDHKSTRIATSVILLRFPNETRSKLLEIARRIVNALSPKRENANTGVRRM